MYCDVVVLIIVVVEWAGVKCQSNGLIIRRRNGVAVFLLLVGNMLVLGYDLQRSLPILVGINFESGIVSTFPRMTARSIIQNGGRRRREDSSRQFSKERRANVLTNATAMAWMAMTMTRGACRARCRDGDGDHAEIGHDVGMEGRGDWTTLMALAELLMAKEIVRCHGRQEEKDGRR